MGGIASELGRRDATLHVFGGKRHLRAEERTKDTHLPPNPAGHPEERAAT